MGNKRKWAEINDAWIKEELPRLVAAGGFPEAPAALVTTGRDAPSWSREGRTITLAFKAVLGLTRPGAARNGHDYFVLTGEYLTLPKGHPKRGSGTVTIESQVDRAVRARFSEWVASQLRERAMSARWSLHETYSEPRRLLAAQGSRLKTAQAAVAEFRAFCARESVPLTVPDAGPPEPRPGVFANGAELRTCFYSGGSPEHGFAEGERAEWPAVMCSVPLPAGREDLQAELAKLLMSTIDTFLAKHGLDNDPRSVP